MDPKVGNADIGTPIKIKQEVPQVLVNSTGITAKDLNPNRFGTSRLPSFRGPRDLTLSALASSSSIQPQFTRTKKTFQPNIPVRREKGDRVVESKSEKSLKRNSNRPKGKLEHGKGRGRFKEKEFVQTKGSLFGEGIATTQPKRVVTPFYRLRGDGSAGSQKAELRRPVLNPNAANNIDKDLEEQRLKEILRDDFIDDVEEIISQESMPIQLPMIALREESQLKTEVEDLKCKRRDSLDAACIVSENKNSLGVRVKQEPGTEENRKTNEKINGLVHHPPPAESPHVPLEGTVAHLLNKAVSDFMLFQLPSCLPGHPPEVKQEPQPSSSHSSNSGNSESGATSSVSTQKAPLCSLSTLPEGRIGSLKIYESGRVEFCLGNHNLEVAKGTQVGFLQDVIRIETDKDSKNGSMVVLGHIKDRLVCTPDFSNLAKNLKLS